jgi:hypothetical protein
MLDFWDAENSARTNELCFRSLRLRHHDEDEKAIHKSAPMRPASGCAFLQSVFFSWRPAHRGPPVLFQDPATGPFAAESTFVREDDDA